MPNDFEALPLEPDLLAATLSTRTGQCVYKNPAWRRILGEGDDWARLADERERAEQCVREAAAGLLVTNQLFFCQVPGRAEALPVLLNFIPTILSADRVDAVASIVVTGEVLREPGTWMQSQTQRNRLETLGRMTMGIAHDFNNLLSGILGYTELLKTYVSGGAPDPSIAEHLRTIEQAALDGAALIRKIQQYIRQEKQTHFEPVDLAALIQDCISLTRPYWYNEPRRQGIAIHLEQHFQPAPAIMGAATELREVFLNLILNAVQAMPKGGLLTFRTALRDSGDVVVVVEDTGTGMPESVRKRIFEPLFTTKGDQGTGMGLSVSYGIVQEHEGTITVESHPGHGTRFTLAFPAARQTSAAAAPVVDAVHSRRARILVVDDEQMVRHILAKLLTLKGHTVRQAASGTEALAIIDAEAFDLVFTDHGMPQMSGRQLARTLRQTHPDLPIVLLTGDTEVGEADEEVDVVLGKPFKIDELQQTIHHLLHERPSAARP